MVDFKMGSNNDLIIQVKTDKLTAQQLRTLKTLLSSTLEMMSSNKENTFFAQSKESLKLWAQLVKTANFPSDTPKIKYANQAIEFSIDELLEEFRSKKFIQLDQ